MQKADRASVAFNLGGDPVKAIHRPQTSLPQQIITSLRDLLAHEFRLNNPNGGSDGWLTEEALWLVSKNAADAVRGWLLCQGLMLYRSITCGCSTRCRHTSYSSPVRTKPSGIAGLRPAAVGAVNSRCYAFPFADLGRSTTAARYLHWNRHTDSGNPK